MFKRHSRVIIFILILGFCIGFMAGDAFAGTISPTKKFGYGEKIGWVNHRSTNGEVTVSSSALSGYAWCENAGWVNFNTSAYNPAGVSIDVSGNLSGFAWGEKVGWIKFDSTNGGVSIDFNGNFSGYAWGENVGWIKFTPDVNNYIGVIAIDNFSLVDNAPTGETERGVSDTITITAKNWKGDTKTGYSPATTVSVSSTGSGVVVPGSLTAVNFSSGAASSDFIDSVIEGVVITATDDSNTEMTGQSAVIDVKRSITISSPAPGDVWPVGSEKTISWTYETTAGSTVNIWYSLDGGTNWTGLLTSSTSIGAGGTGSYTWTDIPSAAQSTTVKIRVKSNEYTGVYHKSGQFKIAAGFSLTAPAGGETWVAKATDRTISWTTSGTAANVNLYYSTNSGVSYPNAIGANPHSNTGSFAWNPLPDLNNATQARVKVEDAADSDAYTTSGSDFTIDYCTVTWNVKDVESLAHLGTLSVDDTSGWGVVGQSSPVGHDYAYDTYSTTWSKSGYNNGYYAGWTISNTASITQSMTVWMETAAGTQAEWHVFTNTAYDADNDVMKFNTWLERNGQILASSQDATIIIYDAADNPVKTLGPTVSPDSSGVFWFTWDTTNVSGDKVYFAKTSITYSPNTYTSGDAFNVVIPKQLKAHETAQATERTAQATERTAQATERTAQATERSAATTERTAQSTERAAQGTFRTDTAATLSTIQTETDKIPLIKAETDKLKAEILNRETSVKSGSTIKVRYRSVSGLLGVDRPEVDVFDASNIQRLADAKMNEIGATGVYAYSLTLDSEWGTGEFTVVCADTTTGQLDSLSLSVLTTDLADIRSAITDVSTSLTTVEGKLDTVDGNIDTLIITCDAVKAETALIKLETDKIPSILTNIASLDTKVVAVGVDVDTILAKWGASTAAEIITYIDTLETNLGVPADLVTADTVFGRCNLLKEKWNTQTAQAIYDAANNAYTTITGVRADLGYEGKTEKVFSDMVLVKGYVDEVESKVDAVDTTVDLVKAETALIKLETDKIAAIKTTVDDTNTKVDNINLDTDAVIAKWDTHEAADIVAYVDNVESRLGTSSDASTADTVFGDVKTLQEKWGDYAASDIYDITAGATVVPYTVSNEVLTAATDAYSQLEALRAEVRALGKTAPAYKALLNLQASLNKVNIALEKLETASTHPLYAQVLELANQLKATGVVKGEKVMSLYEVSAKQAEDVEYLKAKLEELKAISELSKEIVAEKKKESKKAIIRKSWEISR